MFRAAHATIFKCTKGFFKFHSNSQHSRHICAVHSCKTEFKLIDLSRSASILWSQRYSCSKSSKLQSYVLVLKHKVSSLVQEDFVALHFGLCITRVFHRLALNNTLYYVFKELTEAVILQVKGTIPL